MANKIYTFFFVFFLSMNFLFAQSSDREVLYLKNGSIIHGTILEVIPNQTVKIQTLDKNIFVFKMEEVEKIIKEGPEQEKPQAQVYQPSEDVNMPIQEPNEFKTKGYTNITKIGLLGLSALNITEINGYTFNPHLFLGLGVSFDYYRDQDLDFIDNGPLGIGSSSNNSNQITYFLPIFADFRYYVRDKKTTFLTFLDLGYSPLLKVTGNYYSNNNSSYSYSDYKTTSGGIYLCPGIGMKVFLSKNFGLVFDFGLKFQNYNAREYQYNYTGSGTINAYILSTYTTNKVAVQPVLNLGITF